MKISEVIARLEGLKAEHGDIAVDVPVRNWECTFEECEIIDLDEDTGTIYLVGSLS